MWRGPFRVLAVRAFIGFSALSLACSRPDDPVAPEPLPECSAYEHTFNRCMHRDLRLASDPTLIPKTRADEARIRQLCNENLSRIQMACR
jgi:hypothetical protein